MREPFGTYKPGIDAAFLRLLTASGLSRGKVTRWIRKQWMRRNPGRIDAVIRGVRFRLNIEENTTDAKILASSRFYEGEEIRSLASACPGKDRSECVFVDLGANTGYYSLLLAKFGFGKVLAVEPNPPTLGLLRENVELNGWGDRIVVVDCCVGEAGEVDFYQSGGLGNASVLGEDHPQSIPVRVKSQPLEGILEEHGIRQIDALKIDVEGYEDRVLEPFFRSAPESLWPGILVIEHCHSGSWGQDMIEFIQTRGYDCRGRTNANTILQRSGPVVGSG